jgi:hypothetical protein
MIYLYAAFLVFVLLWPFIRGFVARARARATPANMPWRLLLSEVEGEPGRRIAQVIVGERTGHDDYFVAFEGGELLSIHIESEGHTESFTVRDRYTGKPLLDGSAQAMSCGGYDEPRDLIVSVSKGSAPYTLKASVTKPEGGEMTPKIYEPSLQEASSVN